MSLLEDMEEALYGASFDDQIGDSFRYKAAGGAFSDKTGFIDYADQDRTLDASTVIEQAITVEVSKTSVPVKPDAQCRVTLPKLAGKTFKPINVGSDASGNCWTFQLQAVNA